MGSIAGARPYFEGSHESQDRCGRRPSSPAVRLACVMVEGFSKPDFWIGMGIVFGVNAIAAALLGAGVLALVDAVTGFSALLTGAVIGRSAVDE